MYMMDEIVILDETDAIVYAEIREDKEFRERIKGKDPRVLERYLRVVEPGGFCDTVCYFFDGIRRIRHYAVLDELGR